MLINEKNVLVNKQIKKLHWKKLSSFKVWHIVSWSAYELNLLKNQNIYNVFNVTLLELFWDTHHVFSMLTEKDLLHNWDNKWEVEVIMNSWVQNSRLQYLIKWKSMNQIWDNTWESAHFICNIKAKIWKFHTENSDKLKLKQSIQCQCD